MVVASHACLVLGRPTLEPNSDQVAPSTSNVIASHSEAISGRRALDRSRLLRRASAPRNDSVNLVEIYPSQSKAGRTTVRACFSALALDDAASQQARIAVRVVNDTAFGVEDHRRAVRIRIGGPGRDCGIIRAAVAGEGDPRSEIRAASSRAPGAPAVVSATSVLSKTKGRSNAWCAFTRPPWAGLRQSSEYM